MNIKELKEIIKPFIDEPIVNFEIEQQMFNNVIGKEQYNKTIRRQVESKFGVYVWLIKETQEIIYIGMAGKLRTDGSLGKHSILNRLLASRGKDKETKKDVQTNDYLLNFMINHEVSILEFFIIYTKEDEPPAYLESLLLYKFYKKNKKLPILNNTF